MANLAAGDQDTLRVADFAVGDEREEARPLEFLERRGGFRMAKHTLWRKHDQRFAPQATGLSPQQVKILGRIRRLADIHVALGGKLHKPLDSGTRMFRALALVAVGKQQDNAGRKSPLIFAGADKLVDNDLRAVHEVTELRFPKNEPFRVVARKAVLKTQASGFGKRGIVNLAKSLVGRKVSEREILLLGLVVDQHGVALVKRAALGILARQSYGIALEDQRAIRK